ncbi:hypothetical protein HYW72_00325 [Candidatus Nomurabacteria bacterium]|nr:hypothetical protein [Candidatus Nomurabacteria bacterium]
MTTITIPKNLMSEKNLMIVPRSKYEGLLKRLKIIEDYEHLWKSASKNKFFEDMDTDEAVAIYKKEKKQGKLKVLKSLSSLR